MNQVSWKNYHFSKETFKKHLIQMTWPDWKDSVYTCIINDAFMFLLTPQVLQPMILNCSLVQWTNICWLHPQRPHLVYPIHIPLLACFGTLSTKIFQCLTVPIHLSTCSPLLSNSNHHINIPHAMDSAPVQFLLFSNVSSWPSDYIYFCAYKIQHHQWWW